MWGWEFWLFWAILGITAWIATKGRNDLPGTAVTILIAHQLAGVILAVMEGDWRIWGPFCATSVLALPVCSAVLTTWREPWTVAFSLGFVVLFGINFTAYMLGVTSFAPNWFSTIVLYGMMLTVLWPVIREQQWRWGFLGMADSSSDARIRTGLDTPVIRRHRARK